jgi:hypothetical protein
VARLRAARGQRVRGTWPAGAAAGLEEADEDWFVIFQKCRDLTVMSW